MRSRLVLPAHGLLAGRTGCRGGEDGPTDLGAPRRPIVGVAGAYEVGLVHGARDPEGVVVPTAGRPDRQAPAAAGAASISAMAAAYQSRISTLSTAPLTAVTRRAGSRRWATWRLSIRPLPGRPVACRSGLQGSNRAPTISARLQHTRRQGGAM